MKREDSQLLHIPKAESRDPAFSLEAATASGGRCQAAIDRRIGLIPRSARQNLPPCDATDAASAVLLGLTHPRGGFASRRVRARYSCLCADRVRPKPKASLHVKHGKRRGYVIPTIQAGATIAALARGRSSHSCR